MPSPLSLEAAEAIAAGHKVFTDPRRLQLLALVDELGAATLLDLRHGLGALTQPTVSHHVAVLDAAGLVTRNKEGVFVWVALTPAGKRAIKGFRS